MTPSRPFLGYLISALVGGGLATGGCLFWFSRQQARPAAPAEPQAAATLESKSAERPPVAVVSALPAAMQVRLDHALERDSKSITELLASLTQDGQGGPAFHELLVKAINQAKARGDFEQLRKLMQAIGSAERYETTLQLGRIFSSMGPAADLREKLALLDSAGLPKSKADFIRSQVLKLEGEERYAEMKQQGVLTGLSGADFTSVCLGVADVSPAKGFACATDSGSDETTRATAAEIASRCLAGGMMEGSKVISDLPPGVVRDEAIAEMVIMLNKSNGKNEAVPWMAQIVDPEARERAISLSQ